MQGSRNHTGQIVSSDLCASPAGKFIVFFFVHLFICLAAAIIPTNAAAQEEEPAWDRKIQGISILPAREPGRYDIFVAWTAAAEPSSAPLDLSTEVQFYLNGTRIGDTVAEQLEMYPDYQPCEFSGSCGGSCGGGNLNGANFGLLCYEDCPGHNYPNYPPDCDCGAWFKAEIPGEELEAGDEIAVILYPAPGALSDIDTSNDEIRSVFRGGPVYWNRRVRSVDIAHTPGAPPDVYDIAVRGDVSFDGQTVMNLDMMVAVYHNGTSVAESFLAKRARQASDITCFQLGCGSYCGVIDNIERSCDPIMFNGCGCGAGWIAPLPGVHIPDLLPGDEIMVILRPAEGTFPEFWAIDDRLVWEAPVSGVDPLANPSSHRLEQNQPNPFRPETTIRFALDRPEAVRIGVYAPDGRLIRGLADRTYEAGAWSVTWDGRTETGEPAAAGTYFCRMIAGAREETRKMHLLR